MIELPITPTVISALPLENAVRDYLDRNDLVGLEQFLSTRRAPDIADVVDRFSESQRDQLFALLAPRLKAEVLAEAGPRYS